MTFARSFLSLLVLFTAFFMSLGSTTALAEDQVSAKYMDEYPSHEDGDFVSRIQELVANVDADLITLEERVGRYYLRNTFLLKEIEDIISFNLSHSIKFQKESLYFAYHKLLNYRNLIKSITKNTKRFELYGSIGSENYNRIIKPLDRIISLLETPYNEQCANIIIGKVTD